MSSLLSICIPTYNRGDLLDYCLNNLAPLSNCGQPFEIVISDNGSTDRTPEVIETHRSKNPAIRASRFPETRAGALNWINAVRMAKGEFVVYLADDDTLIVDGLLQHLETLRQQPDIAVIFADWIAWDDQAEREIHRYYDGLTESVSFASAAPLDLINFMLKRFYPPEIGVYRRAAMLRAHLFHGRAVPHYMAMYRLSRHGRIMFDPLPFYREHRVLKDRFQRTHWANADMRFHMVGDELRIALESMVLLAVQDAGAATLPPDQMVPVRNSIDQILHRRLGLEIERACGRKNWIMAVELKRRLALWHGPGTNEDMHRDILKIVLQAALQAVQQTFEGVANSPGISLRGFESGKAAEFFAAYFPQTPILANGAAQDGGPAPLILHRDSRTLAADTSISDPAGVMVLEEQMDVYRVSKAKIDLKGF
jgi:hypothetical protein